MTHDILGTVVGTIIVFTIGGSILMTALSKKSRWNLTDAQRAEDDRQQILRDIERR